MYLEENSIYGLVLSMVLRMGDLGGMPAEKGGWIYHAHRGIYVSPTRLELLEGKNKHTVGAQ